MGPLIFILALPVPPMAPVPPASAPLPALASWSGLPTQAGVAEAAQVPTIAESAEIAGVTALPKSAALVPDPARDRLPTQGCEHAAAASRCLPDRVERWRPLAAEASLRFGIPQDWILRVIRAESGGHTTLAGRPIRSPKGAIGLMQLMPGTWAEMRARLALGSDPDAPRDNILAGTAYLRLMYDRFGYPGLFGAYNAGPARYAAWLAGRSRLPGETVAYLGKVGVAQRARGGAGSPAAAADAVAEVAPPALFVVLRTGAQASAQTSAPASPQQAGDASWQALFAISRPAE